MSAQMFLASGHGAIGDGESAATAVAVEIETGFKPKYVRVVTMDETNPYISEWFEGMDAGKGVQLADDTGYEVDEISANGITVGDRGFTLGTECQEDSRKYYWMALG